MKIKFLANSPVSQVVSKWKHYHSPAAKNYKPGHPLKRSSIDFDTTHPTGEEPTVDAPGPVD